MDEAAETVAIEWVAELDGTPARSHLPALGFSARLRLIPSGGVGLHRCPHLRCKVFPKKANRAQVAAVVQAVSPVRAGLMS
jgi:hypothetical protein